jgi:ribonucleotide reductase alpha subunit
VHVEECCVFSSLVAECSASATPVVAQIEKKKSYKWIFYENYEVFIDVKLVGKLNTIVSSKFS